MFSQHTIIPHAVMILENRYLNYSYGIGFRYDYFPMDNLVFMAEIKATYPDTKFKHTKGMRNYFQTFTLGPGWRYQLNNFITLYSTVCIGYFKYSRDWWGNPPFEINPVIRVKIEDIEDHVGFIFKGGFYLFNKIDVCIEYDFAKTYLIRRWYDYSNWGEYNSRTKIDFSRFVSTLGLRFSL